MKRIKTPYRKAETNGKERFINTSVIYPLSSNVVKRTIELCKQNKIKLPDAIIAATALTKGFTLVTRNIIDFKKVPKLDLLNPFE